MSEWMNEELCSDEDCEFCNDYLQDCEMAGNVYGCGTSGLINRCPEVAPYWDKQELQLIERENLSTDAEELQRVCDYLIGEARNINDKLFRYRLICGVSALCYEIENYLCDGTGECTCPNCEFTYSVPKETPPQKD